MNNRLMWVWVVTYLNGEKTMADIFVNKDAAETCSMACLKAGYLKVLVSRRPVCRSFNMVGEE